MSQSIRVFENIPFNARETHKRERSHHKELENLPVCPRCGASVDEGAGFCSKCGSVLQRGKLVAAPSPQPAPPRWYTSPQPPSQWPTQQPSRGLGRSYFNYGVLSAVLSLFFLSEVFGSVAIILGAHTWKKEEGNRGLTLLILGIICMLVGIYFTAYPLLIDLLLPA